MGFRIAVNRIEKAREQIAKMAATPMDYKSEIGQPVIFYFILDVSRSMVNFYNELIEYFNKIIIPSLEEINQRHRRSIRIGCLLFSKNLVPAWKGFKTLKELGNEPLEQKMLNRSELGSTTALYRAMRSGILWTATAMEHMHKTGQGEFPKGKVIVFANGINNESPKKEILVQRALDSINKVYLRNIQLSIASLNTGNGLAEEQFAKMCENTGFTTIKTIDVSRNRSKEERKLSFRQQFHNLF